MGALLTDEVVLCLVGWAPFCPGAPHSPLPSSPVLRQIKAPGGSADCFSEGRPWGGGQLDGGTSTPLPREPSGRARKPQSHSNCSNPKHQIPRRGWPGAAHCPLSQPRPLYCCPSSPSTPESLPSPVYLSRLLGHPEPSFLQNGATETTS